MSKPTLLFPCNTALHIGGGAKWVCHNACKLTCWCHLEPVLTTAILKVSYFTYCHVHICRISVIRGNNDPPCESQDQQSLERARRGRRSPQSYAFRHPFCS